MSVGRSLILITTRDHQLWLRKGICDENPSGTHYLRIPGNMGQADIYETDHYFAIEAVKSPVTGAVFQVYAMISK